MHVSRPVYSGQSTKWPCWAGSSRPPGLQGNVQLTQQAQRAHALVLILSSADHALHDLQGNTCMSVELLGLAKGGGCYARQAYFLGAAGHSASSLSRPSAPRLSSCPALTTICTTCKTLHRGHQASSMPGRLM